MIAMKHRAWTMGLLVAMLVAGTGSDVMAQVQGKIIKKDRGEVVGAIRWQPASKVYVVQQGTVTLRISLSDVARVEVPKPREIDGAIGMVQRAQYATAMPVLEKIMADYQNLQWDLTAARWLAECYLKRGEAQRALDMCERVISASGGGTPSGEFGGVYLDTLIAVGQETKARRILTDMIAKGDRVTAAIAQIKRGDIDQKKGDLKLALVDGYLRTALLYTDAKAVIPEALYKAVKALEQLQQASYADKFRKRLLAEYPRDPYTAKLQSGQ